MTSKKTGMSILAITIVISVVVLRGYPGANASPLSLPSRLVTMEAFNSTRAYFDTRLTNMPYGYDVSDGTYLGWCIDSSIEMQRSPATHEVTLYSSLGSKPGNMENQRWDMVNYVLNHKQGDSQDVQEAIWHFINLNGGYSVQGAFAEAMIDDAVANGAGFVPNGTQAVAVICYPMVLTGEEKVQVTIIEVTPPQTDTSQTYEPTTPSSEPTTPPAEQTPESSPPTDSSPENEPVTPSTDDSKSNEGGFLLGAAAAVSAVCLVGLILLLRRRRRGKLET
jgi:hypothetical protein